MNDPASIRMKLAWQNLFSLRTCPPDRILFSADRDPVLERHIEACPFCAERLSAAEEWSAWETLGSRLAEALPAAEHGAPVPGEIREVKAALGGWGPSNRYYNPPMVFILDIEASPIPCARVAQVCGDAALMGPDDAALPEDKGFVECWNTYALALEDIGRRWGQAPPEILSAVQDAAVQAPQPVPEHSVLFFFRQLELELAGYLAAKSVERLLSKQKSPAHPAMPPAGLALRAFLQEAYPGAELPEHAADDYELLAFSRFPELETPLAADDKGGWDRANCICLTTEGFEVQAVPFQVDLLSQSSTGLLVTGKIRQTRCLPQTIHAWWERPGADPLPAAAHELDRGKSLFRIVFRGLRETEVQNGTLVLLLVGDAV